MQLQAPGSLAALFEALDDNALITRFCEAAALYAQDRGSVASQINVLITAMLRRFPELRYSGRMFRGITISPELMYKHKDANSLMKAIVARSKKMSPTVYVRGPRQLKVLWGTFTMRCLLDIVLVLTRML